MQQVVLAQGGTIDVESTPGNGATFCRHKSHARRIVPLAAGKHIRIVDGTVPLTLYLLLLGFLLAHELDAVACHEWSAAAQANVMLATITSENE